MRFPLLKNLLASLSRGEARTFYIAIAITSVVLTTLGGIALIKDTTVAPASGGGYTEGSLGQPVYVNPVLAQSPVDQALVRLIFSSVTSLADKIDSTDNGKTWDVRLKENIHWTDKEKVTSDDVVFTIQKIEEGDTNSPLAPSWQGVAVDRLSELEIKFTLPAPYAFFKENLANLYVLPKHIFADVPPPNWHLSDYNLKSIGNGPYTFSSYERRPDGFLTNYVLTANPSYFGDKTFIKTITFDFFTRNDDIVRAWNAGQIDSMSVEPGMEASLGRPYNLVAFPSSNYYAVFWNQTRNLALGDKMVRRALAIVIDRAKLTHDIFGVNGIPAQGPLLPSFVTPTSTVTTTSFLLDDASTTLTNAGWIFSAEDGIREKTINKQKVPLAFILTVPDIRFLKNTANVLQSAWRAIGIRVQLNTLPPELIRDTTIKNRSYEALLFGNLLDENYDLFSFWHSSERFSPGLNLALYSNARVDGLIESIRQNLNTNTRTAQFRTLEDTIIADYPAAFLYWSPYLYAMSKDIQGIAPAMLVNPADRFLGISHWYVKTSRVLK